MFVYLFENQHKNPQYQQIDTNLRCYSLPRQLIDYVSNKLQPVYPKYIIKLAKIITHLAQNFSCNRCPSQCSRPAVSVIVVNRREQAEDYIVHSNALLQVFWPWGEILSVPQSSLYRLSAFKYHQNSYLMVC